MFTISFGVLGTYRNGYTANIINRRYFTFIFQLQTWQVDSLEKITQQERPPVMSIQFPRILRRYHCIASRTWASYVAYPPLGQPRPEAGISKCKTPTSYYFPFGKGCHRTKTAEMKQNNEPYVTPYTGIVQMISMRIIADSNLENPKQGEDWDWD